MFPFGSGGTTAIEYAYIAEVASTADGVSIQDIAHTNTAAWDTVTGDAQRIDLSTATASDKTFNIDVNANDITVNKNGRYDVVVTVNGSWDASDSHWMQLVVAGAVVAVAKFSSFRPSGSDGCPVILHWQGDILSGDKVDVRVNGDDTQVTNIAAYSISITEIRT